MSSLLKWYFEKCSLSVLLLSIAAVWVVSAFFMLDRVYRFTPLVYIGLHLITTGVFFWAALRVDRLSHASEASSQAPAQKSAARDESGRTPQKLPA